MNCSPSERPRITMGGRGGASSGRWLHSGMLMLIAAVLLRPALAGPAATKRPNIVFIIDESTDGRAYFVENPAASPMPLPNLRDRLAARGVWFNQTYVAAPVCCPSRAAIWSGRHVHKIPHMQSNPSTGLHVGGAWNNHEGLPLDFNRTMWDLLKESGYDTLIAGKTDWNTGGHSETCRLEAWLNKVNFPYSIKDSWGWSCAYDEAGPWPTSVISGNRTHPEDWRSTQKLVDFIKAKAAAQAEAEARGEASTPFAGYVGMNIVHPPYVTTKNWLALVDAAKIAIPEWKELDAMHPEDFRASMLKKMVNASYTWTEDQIRLVRQVYYAMIAEFDAMVGEILDAVKEAGVEDNTVIISTSDHGDMAMEHRQFYKMSPQDGSSRVPLIIAGPGIRQGARVQNLTSSLDLMPTILEYAGVTPPPAVHLDGQSLVPFLADGTPGTPGSDGAPRPDAPHRPYIMSQFHGDNIHLSWFMLRQDQWKYVTYGSGTEVPPQLFDIDADPGELNNVAGSMPDVVKAMDAQLRQVIDYPSVASEVEAYNKDSFVLWRSGKGPAAANKTLTTGTRFSTSWMYNSTGCFEAVEAWLKTPNSTFHWSHV